MKEEGGRVCVVCQVQALPRDWWGGRTWSITGLVLEPHPVHDHAHDPEDDDQDYDRLDEIQESRGEVRQGRRNRALGLDLTFARLRAESESESTHQGDRHEKCD